MCSCEFTGLITAHCPRCHTTHAGVSSFDRHQSWAGGVLTCHDPAAVRRLDGTPMFTRDHRGYWQLSHAGKKPPAFWARKSAETAAEPPEPAGGRSA